MAELEFPLDAGDAHPEADDGAQQSFPYSRIHLGELRAIARFMMRDQVLQRGQLAGVAVVDRHRSARMDGDVIPGRHPVASGIERGRDIGVRPMKNQQCLGRFLPCAPVRKSELTTSGLFVRASPRW